MLCDIILHRACFYRRSVITEREFLLNEYEKQRKDCFESANAFINAYSPDHATMRAFVDGILGDFPFTGTSPVPLYPEFKD